MAKYLNARDMTDGGGAGRSGQRFEGGILADIANALGIKPAGYWERLESARPAPRPEVQTGAFSAPPSKAPPPPAIGDAITSNGGPLADQRLSSGMPTLGDVLAVDAARLGNQSQRVAFAPPFLTVGEMIGLDTERRAGGSNVPSFVAPAATTQAVPQAPAQRTESDAERIKRQLAESGLVLPDGVLGALLPTLQRMPRISQQREFVVQYLRKNNMPPEAVGPAFRAPL